MNYIDQTLLPDEKVLYRTKKHYIIFLQPLLWTLGACIFLFNSNPIVIKTGLVFLLIAACSWINMWLNYIVSEFAVTNQRIIMREGFFLKHTNETLISTLANLNVTQNILGQLLGYGVVTLKTFGGNDDPFTDIPQPFEFKKRLQEQQSKTAL